jgi:hypothetical protein
MPTINRQDLEAQRAAELEAARTAETAEVNDQVAQKINGWKRLTWSDIFAPRPPVERVVAGLLRRGSISIWYGAPGVQKSLVIADMCYCINSGTRWLRSADGTGGHEVMQGNFAWLDLDNGESLTKERFEAIARGYASDEAAMVKLEPPYIWPLPFPVDLVTDMPTEKSLRSSSEHKSGSSSYRDGKQI